VIWNISSKQPKTTTLQIETSNVAEQYVGRVTLKGRTIVRLLILKHSFEQVAKDEEIAIVQAANLAATKGLQIKDIGSHHINGEGKINWGKKCTLSNLKAFVSEQMKISAQAGDTLIIYTTGHGDSGGGLSRLAQRKTVMTAFAEAAEENNQETLWWQSSCYAAAGLPPISNLNQMQQRLFSMIASSNANRSSYWGDQNNVMKQTFLSLAREDGRLDQNKNGRVTHKELKQFLRKVKKECILYSSGPDEIIFGAFGPWDIPIVDRNNPQKKYSDDYIAIPTR
tara:strand:+ start:38139 stop:38984 length:846 start_codon:yes stop_codon:yes gene_type:complete